MALLKKSADEPLPVEPPVDPLLLLLQALTVSAAIAPSVATANMPRLFMP
jgi:hypothetical protein